MSKRINRNIIQLLMNSIDSTRKGFASLFAFFFKSLKWIANIGCSRSLFPLPVGVTLFLQKKTICNIVNVHIVNYVLCLVCVAKYLKFGE